MCILYKTLINSLNRNRNVFLMIAKPVYLLVLNIEVFQIKFS